MRYDMKFFSDLSFGQIIAGTKTVELRLRDEKRSAIKIGDEINFVGKNGETILAKVVGLCHFKDFLELFKVIDPVTTGFERSDPIEYCAKWMYSIYSAEEIEQYGAFGIVIEKIN